MHRDTENIDDQREYSRIHTDIEDLLPSDPPAQERLSGHLGDTVGVDQDVVREQKDRRIQKRFLTVDSLDDREAHETDIGKYGHQAIGRERSAVHLQQVGNDKRQRDQAGIQDDRDQCDLQEFGLIGAAVIRGRGRKDQAGICDIDHESGNMLRGGVVQEFDLVAYKADGHNDEQDRHLI